MKYSLLIMKAKSIRRIKIIQKKNIYSWSLLVLLPKSYSWHFLFLLCTFLVANCILKTIWFLYLSSSSNSSWVSVRVDWFL